MRPVKTNEVVAQYRRAHRRARLMRARARNGQVKRISVEERLVVGGCGRCSSTSSSGSIYMTDCRVRANPSSEFHEARARGAESIAASRWRLNNHRRYKQHRGVARSLCRRASHLDQLNDHCDARASSQMVCSSSSNGLNRSNCVLAFNAQSDQP